MLRSERCRWSDPLGGDEPSEGSGAILAVGKRTGELTMGKNNTNKYHDIYTINGYLVGGWAIPLLMTNIAIENGDLVCGFTHS